MPVPAQPLSPTEAAFLAGTVLYACVVILALLVFTFEKLHQLEINELKRQLTIAEAKAKNDAPEQDTD